MGGEGVPHLVGRVGPLDAGVESLGVLPEDHGVHRGLFEPAIRRPPDEVQRVSGKGAAGADADVEIELLAQPDDGAEVDEALVPELRSQLRGGLVLGLGGDGPEEAQVVLRQKVQGPLREGVALLDPELPADVGVDVVGLKAHGIQNSKGLLQNDLSNPVSGHGDHGMACHCRLHSRVLVFGVRLSCPVPISV